MNKAFPPAPTRVVVAATGTKVEPPGNTFGPRRQWSHEFIWVRSGTLTAKIDSRTLKAGPGTVLLVPPAATDSYRYPRREKSIHSFIHFHLGAAPKGWPPRPPFHWPLYRQLPSDHLFFHLFRQVLALNLLDAAEQEALLGPTVWLMLRYYLYPGKFNGAEAAADPGLSASVERALYWLRDRVRGQPLRKIRLDDISRVAFVSPQNLCRLFKKELQIGPMECARLLRVEYAGVLLERSHLTVKEVSNLTGFENPFHFSRVFKGVYGVSPQNYREGFKKKNWFRPSSPIFRRYHFQRIRFNSLLGPPADSFRFLPKKYRIKLK